MRRSDVLLVLLTLPACTDVRLWKTGELERVSVDAPRPKPIEPEHRWTFADKPADAVRYTLGDVFCTTPSMEVTIPFKLLVIMDYSGSMDLADPGGLRIRAVVELVNRYASDPSVYFGFLRFGSLNYPLTSLGKDFVNDPTSLAAALLELRQSNTVPQGATNYQAALEWAWDAIDTDIRRPNGTPGTRYGVLFVTDGRPNEPEQGTPDQALAANRPKVRDRITGCDGYKAFQPLSSMIEFMNTYFINVGGADQAASLLLRDMAEGASHEPCGPNNWGHGKYQEVQSAADLVFDLDLPKLTKVFVNRGGFIFLNRNLRAAYENGQMVMSRDSDGDGLADFVEVDDPGTGEYASSRHDADTDHDGISDLVAYALGAKTNNQTVVTVHPRPPHDPELKVSLGMLTEVGKLSRSEHDVDGDGLTNDEELFLGTSKLYPDTDQDGLIDSVEIHSFLDPNDPHDAGADMDGDGVDSRTEIETGMDPIHPEPPWFRQQFAWQVSRGSETTQAVLDAATGTMREVTCYDFSVRNILFRPPVDRSGNRADLNVFELDFLDQTRIPRGDLDYALRREVVVAKPDLDRPELYLKRTLPGHW
ncbi:MAG: VWA domain-containing protein [Deltaproteobacteria bacterium]|nr:VWA domain-containing protein [Deltaproteobacteria bacterium]